MNFRHHGWQQYALHTFFSMDISEASVSMVPKHLLYADTIMYLSVVFTRDHAYYVHTEL